MTDTTKLDLSREAVEQMAADLEGRFWTPIGAAEMLVALLDAKEAAERAYTNLYAHQVEYRRNFELQLTEARASAAAAWEAGRDAARDCGGHYMSEDQDELLFKMWDEDIAALTNPSPSATESLRRVKEAEKREAWDEAVENMAIKCEESDAGLIDSSFIRAIPNPYAAKEAAHG